MLAMLRTQIIEQFPLASSMDIQADTNLLQTGVMDSFGMLELIQELERRFGISIDDGELIEANFSSLRAMAGFLASKNAQP